MDNKILEQYKNSKHIILRNFCTKINERIIGPYEWIQLTYDTLRVSPDGEEIMKYCSESDSLSGWYLYQDKSFWTDVIIG